jgi:hypothetical protein
MFKPQNNITIHSFEYVYKCDSGSRFINKDMNIKWNNKEFTNDLIIMNKSDYKTYKYNNIKDDIVVLHNYKSDYVIDELGLFNFSQDVNASEVADFNIYLC